MERKWNQEKALREAAETRVKALKKKIRAMENQNCGESSDAIKEDESVGTTRNGGMHSRTNSLDGPLEFPDNVGAGSGMFTFSSPEASLHTRAQSAQAGFNSLCIVDRTANNITSINPTTELPNSSPPRDTKKAPFQSPSAPVAQKKGDGARDTRGNPTQTTLNQARQPSIIPSNMLATNEQMKSSIGGDPSGYNTQQLPMASNLGAPPRPKHRKEVPGASGVASVWSLNTSDFDPLRPVQKDPQSGDFGSTVQMQQLYTDTSQPVAQVSSDIHAQSVDSESSADLMSFRPSTQPVPTYHDNPSSTTQEMQQQPQATMMLHHPVEQGQSQSQQQVQWVGANSQPLVTSSIPPDMLSAQAQATLQSPSDPFDDLVHQRRA